MNTVEFDMIREEFRKADVDGKIDIYVNSDDLSQEQYRELLKLFPVNEIPKLETALNAL